MKKMIFALTCLLLAIPCHAKIITVNWDGSGDYLTIQEAINDSNDGDIVEVRQGIYYENIRMRDGITLQGSGPNVTTINGGGNGHVVVFNLASGTICGFTITNSGTWPGYLGAIFSSQCTVRIEDNIVMNK